MSLAENMKSLSAEKRKKNHRQISADQLTICLCWKLNKLMKFLVFYKFRQMEMRLESQWEPSGASNLCQLHIIFISWIFFRRIFFAIFELSSTSHHNRHHFAQFIFFLWLIFSSWILHKVPRLATIADNTEFFFFTFVNFSYCYFAAFAVFNPNYF